MIGTVFSVLSLVGPPLIHMAEGLFINKPKSGAEKAKLVLESVKGVIDVAKATNLAVPSPTGEAVKIPADFKPTDEQLQTAIEWLLAEEKKKGAVPVVSNPIVPPAPNTPFVPTISGADVPPTAVPAGALSGTFLVKGTITPVN